MSTNWPPLRTSTDADMQLADALLDKADALLKRHRAADRTSASAPQHPADDLPLLTDVVADHNPAAAPSAVLVPPQPEPVQQQSKQALLAETLIQLDTDIGREVETWLATELPQILSRELGGLADRIRKETLAQLRATLLPALSERIASEFDSGDE